MWVSVPFGIVPLMRYLRSISVAILVKILVMGRGAGGEYGK